MAQTTNIGLYKLGAQSKLKDFPNLFNDDLDIIDSTLGYGFGQGTNPTVKASIDSISDRVDNSDMGTFSSVSDFESALNALINGINEGESKDIKFTLSSSTSPFMDTTYFGEVKKSQNGNYWAVVHTVLNNMPITGRYRTSTNSWYWAELALNSKVTYNTIINLQQITSSYVTRNTYNSRKFSDYQMLVFTPYENNWARASCIVPTYVFENATGIDIRYYQGGNLIEVDIKRTSDTSYDAKYIGTPPSSEGVFIYCFGLLGK